MSSSMRRLMKKVVTDIFPRKWSRILKGLVIVPGDYGKMVRGLEDVIDLCQNQAALDDEYWCSVLRKYTHILDKGLQQCDCEPGHSSQVYRSALDALAHVKSDETRSDPSFVWAVTRISEYEHLQSHGCVSCGAPGIPQTLCTYDHLVDAIKTRRSIRTLKPVPVDEDTILNVFEALVWSPTSCNRQTAKAFIATEQSLVRACLSTCAGATGFSEFVPCFVSFCADLRPYGLPDEMMLPTLDAGLGIQNCCLLAHSLGLSITLLSWALHTQSEERELRRLLGIPGHHQIVANAVIGYPQVGAPVPSRKPASVTCVIRSNEDTSNPQRRAGCQ